MLPFARALVRQLFHHWLTWLNYQRIQFRYPELVMVPPILWSYDTLRAIRIGSNVIIHPFTEIMVLAQLPQSAVQGRLTLEDRVIIRSYCSIVAIGGEIHIGRDSGIGQHSTLIAANHTLRRDLPFVNLPLDESKTGIVIGANVWIGAGTTILPGCAIGDNAVIGAGSVVTRTVPANEIWFGVPARKHKDVMAD